MRSVDSTYLNMALAVQRIIASYPTEVASRKMLETKVLQMHKSIKTIQEHMVAAAVDNKSHTQAKRNAGEAAVDLALVLADNALEHAKGVNDVTLQSNFNLSERHFSHVQGMVAVSRLRDLIKQLQEAAKQLRKWDITAQDIDKLETLTDTFENQMSSPYDMVVMRKTHDSMIRKEISKLRQLFESMDNLMSKFQGTAFLMDYKAARMVAAPGTRRSKEPVGWMTATKAAPKNHKFYG